MKYDFTTRVNRKEHGSFKWEDMYDKKPDVVEGIVPLSVADMEFKNAPEIIEGLKKYLDEVILGYTGANKKFKTAVVNWMKDRHNFKISEEWIVNTAGVVPAFFNGVREFTKEGEGVIVMSPVYYPFFDAIKLQNRKLIDCPLIKNEMNYTINYDLFDELTQKSENKVLLFCSPHNPVGRVWTQEELKRLEKIILKNKVLLLSDEIHFDIIMPNYKHIVFQTLSDELAEQTITFTAPSKTFNLAGMGLSNIIIKNKKIREKFIQGLEKISAIPFTVLGYKACELAYNNSREWLKECLNVIYHNSKIIKEFFEKKYPEIKTFPLEGTYLLWVDFNSLNMSAENLEKFMIDNDIFLDEGYIFGKNARGFERFNLAVPTNVIEETLIRLDLALQKL